MASTTSIAASVDLEIASCGEDAAASDTMLTGYIRLGHQRFRVALDFTSTELWVLGKAALENCLNTEMEACPGATQHSFYEGDGAASDEYVIIRDARSGHDLFRGQVATDTLYIGSEGNQLQPITVHRQSFLQVTNVIHPNILKDCEGKPIDGVLGLGIRSDGGGSGNSRRQHVSVIDRLFYSGSDAPMTTILPNKILSMYLSTTNNTDDAKVSETTHTTTQTTNVTPKLFFGGVDQRYYHGCLTWHEAVEPLPQKRHQHSQQHRQQNYPLLWSIQLENVLVGGFSIFDTSTAATVESHQATLDPTLNTVRGPQQSVVNIAKRHGGRCGRFENGKISIVDCSTQNGFDAVVLHDCNQPVMNLDLEMDGSRFVLKKENLVARKLPSDGGGEQCVMRIAGVTREQGWELGLPFFEKYYAAYDFENKQVGLSLGCGGDCINRQCKHDDASLDVSSYLHPSEKHHDAQPIKSAIAGPAQTAKKGNAIFVVLSVLIVLMVAAVMWRRRKRNQLSRNPNATAAAYRDNTDVEEINGHLSIDIQMLDAMN